MNIAIIGNDGAFNEAKTKLGASHQYRHVQNFNRSIAERQLDIVFDFNSEWDAETAMTYSDVSAPVFLNTVFSTLNKCRVKTKGFVFGFCGFPTFFDRNLLEVVSLEKDKTNLQPVMKSLGLDFILVKDKIGMVTPRVICMIINEAYEAFQQGVSSKEDIDLSMKLGTNYPFGPFEWSDRIGLGNVARLLTKLGQPLAF